MKGYCSVSMMVALMVASSEKVLGRMWGVCLAKTMVKLKVCLLVAH